MNKAAWQNTNWHVNPWNYAEEVVKDFNLPKKVKERITKPLEVHVHPDFGLGVANTINAIISGAEVIHTTITGIGEKAGNTPMEETVLALLAMDGINLGIDYKKIN